ncbi:hypothetical protein L6258_01480, partial [Candidatus Parcubacteria bacterium]|nr:hypothetical protein [Candidatus Parcubacteria bacterium]
MFPKILLVLALLVANTTGAAGQGGEVVTGLIPPEGIPIPDFYQLAIAQDPADPRVFHIIAPNEVITPVRAEAVIGGDIPMVSGR